MDLTWARVLFTVGVFVFFMLVLVRVFSKQNKRGYEELAQTIVNDPDTPDDVAQSSRENGAK